MLQRRQCLFVKCYFSAFSGKLRQLTILFKHKISAVEFRMQDFLFIVMILAYPEITCSYRYFSLLH